MRDIINFVGNKLGIVNIAEYSLCLTEYKLMSSEEEEEINDETIKGMIHKKLEKRENKKIEKMKKQLHTDDEIKWLFHEKQLCEQGVDLDLVYYLRRKYFYEANENISDPMEVNLLYNQVIKKIF